MNTENLGIRSMITVPPTYQFPNLHTNCSGLKKWGWHRAQELRIAVSNLHELSVEASHFNVKTIVYPDINPFSKFENVECIVYVTQEGEQGLLSKEFIADSGKDWLSLVVFFDYYIASGIGLQLLEAVKNPKMAAFKHKAKKILLG